MSSDKPDLTESMRKEPADFSLVLGGPLFQFFRKTHLCGDSLEMVHRRIIVISLFAWLPLLILAALEGRLIDSNGSVPFLFDIDVHVKFLIVVPLLIAAEQFMHSRLRYLEVKFKVRKLIPEADMPRFEKAVASSYRLRNSVVAEIMILIIVYVVGVLIIWRMYNILPTETWYCTSPANGTKILPAGLWYGYVSLPIYQFLLLRWYYRILIWIRFLWKVSRIDLKLVPMHPDRTGGLGFLCGDTFAFLPIMMAHGAILAGLIANRIFFTGAKLPDFKFEIFSVMLILLALILGPLLVFTPKLDRARRKGRREFSAFAMKYVREFDTKWLRSTPEEQLLGTADIQSLADLTNSYAVVRSMHYIPITKEAFFQLAAAVVIPVLPLVLTMMPLAEIFKKLAGIVL